MDSECNTDSLRSMASHWTLAGDDNLLNILQNTHKKIVLKCEEVNAKLDEMVFALDDADINLQNVNNKFLALSNSQFIESRVYDDDEVTEEVAPVKEMAPQPQPSQSDMVKKSLSILESMHEVVTILRDSDTESDSDDEDIARLVLKPKEMYRDRPLPYIIGSEAWKSKWHAGLIVEDSDTDSATSKPEGHTPEYSESEDDEPVPSQKSGVYEKEKEFVRDEIQPETEMTPSAMAAELARRLAAQAPLIPEPEEEYSPPRRTVKTVYKPQQPATGVIFSDEPPPLEDGSDSGQEDIFAELHSSEPYSKNEEFGKRVADDLFGVAFERTDEDIFDDGSNKVSQDDVVPEFLSVTNERNPRLEEKHYINEDVTDKASKKPVGGISVFGSSRSADSIGAAILKRNVRKQSTSDDESHSSKQPPPRTKNTDQTDSGKKEKDILNDLFAKPKTVNKKSYTKTEPSVTDRTKEDKIKEEKPTEKIDLFSDNIFDDIDDIFSSNIVKMPNAVDKVNKQSIFDDDIDLFADIAPSTITNKGASSIVTNKITNNDKGGLFDSDDDDLFCDKSLKTHNETGKNESQSNIRSNSATLYDTKNETEDLFNATSINTERTVLKTDIIESKKNNEPPKKSTNIDKEPKNIFDSDSDNDIFSSISSAKPKMDDGSKAEKQVKLSSDIPTSNATSTKNTDVVKNTPKLDPIVSVTETENLLKIGVEVKKKRSPFLFDEEDDNLFSSFDHNNRRTDDTKKIEENDKPRSDKFNNHVVRSNGEQINSNIKIKDITKAVSSPDNITDMLSEDKSNEYLEAAVLNSNDTTTVILDKETMEKANIFSETEPKNIESTNTDNETEVLFSEEYSPISNKDILNDMVTEPPAFEKPKEPKKSKNVNALFDDDSDDETLFFRRSDAIDEVPQSFSSSVKQDALFGVFYDEPPAMDIDFGTTVDVPDETKSDSDKDLYSNPQTILDVDNNSLSKLILPTAIITETASPALIKSDDFTEYKDIFSSIHSENIFTPKQDYKLPSNRLSVDEGNNFDNLFNTSQDNSGTVAGKPDIKRDEILTTSISNTRVADKTLYGVTNDNLKDNLQVKIGVDTKKTEASEPNDLFSCLKIPPKLNEKISPVIPDFDDPCEDLFKPSTSIANVESNLTSSQSSSDLFGAAGDSEILMSKNEGNKVNVSKDKNDNTLGNDFQIDIDPEFIFSGSDNQQTKASKGKTVMEDKLDTEENLEKKQIGKLKNMNFNIDVATLLPGASPKKQNKSQMATTIHSEEQINVKNKVKDSKKPEATMVKSISFEGEPNSDVLDNKLSKERAKIQVKRRPSTRKARKEAVRKSAIDLDDSTDNSSSIEDPPKNITDLKEKTISPEVLENKDKNIEVLNTSEKSTNYNQEPTVTKIVYILNDDDIFSNKSKTDDHGTDYPIQNTDNTTESKGESVDYIDGIKTIGKVYKSIPTEKPETTKMEKVEESGRKTTKPSLFDDPSDDELFNKNKKIAHKASIFDSDSEEDLFTGKKREVEKKIEVKSSLFGDDDDDNQLFAVKSKKPDTKTDAPRPHISRETMKSTEPVFNDPLSLLDDDE